MIYRCAHVTFHEFSGAEPQNFAVYYDEIIWGLLQWQRKCRTLPLPGEVRRVASRAVRL